MTVAVPDLPPPADGSRLSSVLRHDVPASLVVFLVALPLSVGIAVASGAPIMAGLIAAVVGGIVAGALGGSPLQVSGPAAGLTVVVAGLVAELGFALTCLVTVAAGVVQVLMGLSRVARAALAISPVVVHAMLAGIGLTIALQQVHVLLGGQQQESALANIAALPAAVLDTRGPALVVGGLVVVLMLSWPRMPASVRAVPASLVAVVTATLLAAVADLDVARVELPGNLISSLALPALPEGQWGAVATGVLTVALVASVESLLSAVAVDKMQTGPRTNFDRELLGQGAANMASGVLGGLPVTGVIVRSAANVTAGARSRASAVLHGVWLLLFSVLLISVVEQVPFAVLAGLLVVIGLRLVKLADVRTARRTGDVAVYAVTVLGVVFLNLLEGVLIGLALAVLLVLRRVVWASVRAVDQGGGRWRVVVQGSLSFLSLPRLTRVLGELPPGTAVTVELGVDFLDHAAYDAIHAWIAQHESTGGSVVVDERGTAGLAAAYEAPPRRLLRGSTVRTMAPWSSWQGSHAGGVHAAPHVAGASRAQQRVFAGVQEFHRHTADLVRPHLSELVDGQHPDTFFLTCADSRVVPNVITASGPGDLFTIRNIGNLVPSGARSDGGTGDASVEAALQYAVDVLGVTSVVVCGHSGCGAMGALLASSTDGALSDWLAWGAPSVEAHAMGHPVGRAAAEDGRSEADQLAMVNVAVQLQTLQRHPVVGPALAEGRLTVTGLFFDIQTASVHQVGVRSTTALALA